MKKMIIRLLDKLRLLRFFNANISVRFRGKRFFIPVIKGLGKDALHISEEWMCSLFEVLLKAKAGTVIDVGVNTGQTLIKLKAVDDQRPYIGFEPNPGCIFYLQELVRINKFSNTIIYPVGLSDKTTLIELNFFSDDAGDSSASIISNFRSASAVKRKEFVACFSLADINLPLDNQVSLIKIDVEGAELEVLNSLFEILKRERPFIIIEILPVYDNDNQLRLQRQKKIEQLLMLLNYKIFRIHKQGKSTIGKMEMLPEIGIHATIEWSDYLFCPEEKLSIVKLLSSNDE